MSNLQQYKICLLGTYQEPYTKMMMIELDKENISYEIILVKPKQSFLPKSLISKTIQRIYNFLVLINSERFKNLPKNSFYFWKKIFELKKFERSSINYNLFKEYLLIDFDKLLENKLTHFTQNINSAEIYLYLQEKKYDIGILGRVEIVTKPIIDCFQKFILNTHPAPLPECRGAGELIFTFYYNLTPSVTIHEVTPRIDEGKILKQVELKITKNDTYYSILSKLGVLRYKVMSKTVKEIIENKQILLVENNGKLHQWKDCTIAIQKKADQNLEKLKKSLHYV